MQLYLTQFFFKTVMVIFMAIFFVQCNSDDPAREAAKEAALKKENTAGSPAGKEAPAQPVEVGKLPMQITSAKASKGSETCVSVKVSQFNDIVSMQYTMKWDPAILTFKEVKNFGLPGLEEANFGTKAADKGILAYSWFDANVQGITKPDGTNLYDVCFEAKGEAGNTSSVEFANAPVVIEITNSASQFLGIEGANGKVTVE
ncbi:MAG: cohesin domain-containing protein [Saprospiraceae bacterium]